MPRIILDENDEQLNMMRQAFGVHNERTKPQISNVGKVARLQDWFAIFTSTNRYKVGDWITPRKDVELDRAGEPFLVIDTAYDNPKPFNGRMGDYGNIRVAYMIEENHITAPWFEAHNFEPYVDPSENPVAKELLEKLDNID